MKGKSKTDTWMLQKRERVQRNEEAVLFGKNSTSLNRKNILVLVGKNKKPVFRKRVKKFYQPEVQER